jgi:thiamine biosynthesis lipoprotein
VRRTPLFFLISLVLLLFVILWSTRGQRAPSVFHETRFMMGTAITIKVMAPTERHASRIVDAAFDEMRRVEALVSWEDTSDLTRLSDEAPSLIPVSKDLIQILVASREVADLSDGALDVTIGPVLNLWGRFQQPDIELPSPAAIDSALTFVDYRSIMLDPKGVRAGLARKGMSLDLGAVAKGYAVDRAIGVLKTMGITNGLIEAGGDLRVIGQRPGGGPWRIGLQHPRRPDSLLVVVEMGDGAVATSGDYQRCFTIDGVRYHHILNPRSGVPARGCASVTVLASSAIMADAWATAIFVMGPGLGMEMLERLEGIEGIIVVARNGELTWYASSGMDQWLRMMQ